MYKKIIQQRSLIEKSCQNGVNNFYEKIGNFFLSKINIFRVDNFFIVDNSRAEGLITFSLKK
jgi:hypothetical protein